VITPEQKIARFTIKVGITINTAVILRVCEDLDFAMASAALRARVTDWTRSGCLGKSA